MNTQELKEIIDRMLFDLEFDINVDKKGKVKYDELVKRIMDIRVKINKLK